MKVSYIIIVNDVYVNYMFSINHRVVYLEALRMRHTIGVDVITFLIK